MTLKTGQFLLAIALLLATAHVAADDPAMEIDALSASAENFTLLLENEYVRVLDYVLLPGEEDQWHTHPSKVFTS